MLAVCGTARAGVIDVSTYQGSYKGPKFSNVFVAEGRIGDSARRPGNRSHELSLSRSVGKAFAAEEAANTSWRSGEAAPFELNYDGAGHVTFKVGSVGVSHLTPADSSILNGILFKAKTTKGSASLIVEDLKLDGQSIGLNLSANGNSTAMLVKTDLLKDGFVLRGTIRMEFLNTGKAVPRNSDISLQIAAGHVAPEPASLLLLSAVSALWRARW